VADYAHVPEGPGIMLVTHAITFSLDRSGGRFGLRAQQRRSAAIAATLRATLAFADLLERDSRVRGRLLFDRSSIERRTGIGDCDELFPGLILTLHRTDAVEEII